ncbi:MAG: DNA gyrase subunit A [Proteobacteria bacterium]|nr:DNA gyrase subunit A [Cystobacterineae bacterium]MCL2258322.1 DNA gyrase subunit A [Cystobacterineae bacterium]MCL2315347.1 DNA gyrase subunit A [Pseudomonadota bacterium]
MSEEKQAPGVADGVPNSAGEVSVVTIEEEMRRSYLDYSMSVIVGRALPDIRDGLKPVHRRVLFAMHELSNTHQRPYKKSARVVGDVIGKYHPHGDQAVYDALVRMAQPWSMRLPLVDGQGNFGSVDGDEAAAMRYTEVRMERLCEHMLADLEKDTVDFSPNYDGQDLEPNVLPARFPNLLVNGSEGIAVGMATKIPPHNLGEVVDAAVHLVDNPSADVLELMHFIQGPDFPTAGFILGREGIRKAYETGRGSVAMRAKTDIEVHPKTERESIVVTEIPFQVNKARLIERIAELVNEKKLEGISDIRDESDRKGMRVVIELKRDAVSAVVLNNLYAQTPLQSSFGVVMLAIVDGQPRILTLKEVLERFLLHRREVVTRRSRFELKKAKERLHITEGLLVAQDVIDHVISIIRASPDVKEAKWGLTHAFCEALYENPLFAQLPRLETEHLGAQIEMLVARAREVLPDYSGLSFDYTASGFSEEQATNILEMRLQRLTGMQKEELFKEMVELCKTVAYLEDILGNESSLLRVIKTELLEVRERYADERRTEIIAQAGELSTEDLIANEPMVVTLSHAGYIKRTSLSEYRAQRRGGRGKMGATTKEDDFISDVFIASTHSFLMPITTHGKLYWLKVHELPLASRASRGKPIVNFLQLAEGEKLAQVLVAKEFSDHLFVLFVSKKGTVKRTDLSAFSNVRSSGIIALGIEEGDGLVAVKLTDGTKDVLLSTAQGLSIRFAETDVRSMGRVAYGVKGITLAEGDEVVGAEVVEKGATLLTVTERGFGKRTKESEYRRQGRGGKGIIDIKTTARNGQVVGLIQVKDEEEVMLMTNAGTLIRMVAKEISVIGRNTQGVRLIALEDEEEKVAGISRLPEIAEEGGVAEGEDSGEAEAPPSTDEPSPPSASETQGEPA